MTIEVQQKNSSDTRIIPEMFDKMPDNVFQSDEHYIK